MTYNCQFRFRFSPSEVEMYFKTISTWYTPKSELAFVSYLNACMKYSICLNYIISITNVIKMMPDQVLYKANVTIWTSMEHRTIITSYTNIQNRATTQYTIYQFIYKKMSDLNMICTIIFLSFADLLFVFMTMTS